MSTPYAPITGSADYLGNRTPASYDTHSSWPEDNQQHFDPYNQESNANLYNERNTERYLPVPDDTDAALIPIQKRTKSNRRRRILIWAAILFAVVAIAAVVAGVLLSRRKTTHSSSSPSNQSPRPSGTNRPPGRTGATSGGNDSTVTLENGDTFVYINNFGGDWIADPTKPFAPGGRAQSWSPRVGNESWVWGQNIARGVNLGGWLVTEPFIVPALYEKYTTAGVAVTDEWTLSIAMGSNLATEMENHYATFITEEDFAAIAAAGLNYIRIPIGFWAIETMNDEPFLVGTSWKYFLKAVAWARKYGLRIYLDLHALPGSQNGWNHSGRVGSVNLMHGVMGIANAQRAISYLRILIEFVSQPQYRDVVGILGMVNEILWSAIGETAIQSFYLEAYNALRRSTGTGDGNGPYVAIHEGFQGVAIWHGFLAGADRLALDQHPYLAFTGDASPLTEMAVKPCNWAVDTNLSSQVFGLTVGGEFSAAINNCGLWLNGIGTAPSATGCDVWDDWANYDAATIRGLRQVTLASMDALQNFFFWTWKIGNSTVLGRSSNPMWHYQLGMQRGWIPTDPREAIGHCAAVLGSSSPFDGNYPASAIGSGAGTVAATQIASHPFPPATVSPSFSGTQVRLLPTYTPTGTIKTLPGPTFTAAPTVDVGDGWFNPDDTDLAYVPIRGCTYPDAWDAVSAPLPRTVCTGS